MVGPTMIWSDEDRMRQRCLASSPGAVGLRLVGSTTRDIGRYEAVPLPVPQRAGHQNDLAKHMTREVVLVLRKA